ncbi:hypothetical protein V502_10661 [Pseudogymnoascus sp. VKM F-4520 (FW-2644)]|nr:hypothetical protein V502_10661 [Pseudogymnoascus sp. VKM F-4520 (FW-2644)]
MASLLKSILLTLTIVGIRDAIATTTNQNHFGTFQLPSIQVRPKFRYWLPDASISSDALAADLKEIGSIGAGGVEFLPYYNYGGTLGPPATDWTKYGYGTPAYNVLVKKALQASKDNGLLMDLCMGPQSGQGVPASPDNPGLAYSMVYNYTTVAPGGTFKAKIPGFGLGKLISVTTAAILTESVASYPDHSYIITASNPVYNRTSFTISEKSLKDVTKSVSVDGILSVTFPTNEGAKKYIVFGAYYQLSLDRACVAATSNPQNILQNGSFAVDHFSLEGAKVTTDFLEKYVMINGVRELFKQIGKYIWEDSVEVASEVYWTPKLKDTFYKLNGYDVGKFVMLLTIDNGLTIGQNYPTSIKTDAEDGGQGYVEDYRNALTTSLQYYYKALTDWSKSYVGAEFSGQIGYNLPVDGSQVIPEVGAPEDESLAFDLDPVSLGSLDTYRQYVGPANLAGKRVISNEMGAVFNNVYKQTLPQLLHSTKRAWAVGNNQMVWHGAVFSGQFPNTTWPGFTSFGYLFGEPWSKHQPVWKNGFAEVNDFVGRTQWVLQSGIPQRDVAFWYKSQLNIVRDDSISNNFTDLIAAGYGYEFISPANFDLALAKVKNKILAPDGPSYKVLVLRSDDSLTLAGTQKLVQYAKQGLPIVIQGGIPNKIASANGLKQAQANVQSILSLKNVRQVGPGPLAPTLASMGIQPRTKVSGATWLTYWRYDRNACVNYVLVFNDGTNRTSGTVTFQSTDKPFLLNAWTGTEEPILNYVVSHSDDTTIIPLTLAAGQTILVAFKSNVGPMAIPQTHITAATVPILGYVYKQPNRITIKVPASSAKGSITLSNSNTVHIPPQQARAPITLRNWLLNAESWTPSPNFFDSNSIGTKTNKTFTLPDLASWSDIPGLANTSGIGYYSNSFTWNPSSDGSGAFIDFGAIQNTVRVRINDKTLPPLDLSAASADISAYLQKGKNTVEAIAATTLYNALVPIYPQLLTGGTQPTFGPGIPGLGGVPSVPAGLLETVVITPYNLVSVS